MKMSDYPDEDMGRFPGAVTFRVDFNSLKKTPEPMVTVSASLLARALTALDDVGFANVPGERLDFTERVRGEIRYALGVSVGDP